MDKKLIQQLTEYGQNLSAGGVNEIAIANVIALVITELQQKPVPEAYMGYALYDSDSTLYGQGKVILSKKARNKHEELIEKIAIKKDGYIETYLVNETAENVWFDQFRVMSTGPIIVQETHYDPWGMEIKELGYQYGGIKVNPYLYNGKEANGHLGVNIYDFGARMYDPAIGRWFVLDPLAEKMRRHSPYNYAFNNPLRYIDPDGMEPYEVMGAVTQGPPDAEDPTQKSVLNGEESAPANECEGCRTVDLEGVTVTATRLFAETSQNDKPQLLQVVAMMTLTAIQVDVFTPDPSDLFVPKWVGEVILGGVAAGVIYFASEHTKNARPSTKTKHEEGQARKAIDRGGEDGDKNRRPPRKRPPNWKGTWPPK